MSEPTTSISAASDVATIVCRHRDGLFEGSRDGSAVTLQRAVSCLVEPQPGDQVLTACHGGKTFVLAVLQHGADTTAAMRIDVDGDLYICAKRVTFQAEVFGVVATTVTMMGSACHTLFRHARRIFGTEEVTAQSTSLRAGDRVAVIGNADVQQAGVISQRAEGAIAVQSETAVLSAKADIRLNGERINVG